MQKKWPLYIGLTLLATGIILKSTTEHTLIPLIIMLLGIALKIYYISKKMVRKEYNPGLELLFLAFGLILFFGSIYLTKGGLLNPPISISLKIAGISLKVTFLILFIIKTRRTQKNPKPAIQ